MAANRVSLRRLDGERCAQGRGLSGRHAGGSQWRALCPKLVIPEWDRLFPERIRNLKIVETQRLSCRDSGLGPVAGRHRSRRGMALEEYERKEERRYFFFAPTRSTLLISSAGRPDFSAISRSCSAMAALAGSSPSSPPNNSEGTRRLERCEPSS